MKIGIPRALFYYKKPYFWETFFENLGFEVILSPQTNKEIVEKGVKAADSEQCFSAKVLYGHILSLEGKVDLVFIPRLKKNESGLEYCPKFFALPDLFSHLISTPIVSAWVDLKKENFRKILLKLATKLGKRKEIAQEAIKKGFLREKEEEERVKKEYLRKINSPKPKIVLISHPYNLYDEYVNLGIKDKLAKLGTEVLLIDEVPINSQINMNKISGGSQEINFHWEFGKEMMEKVKEILRHKTYGLSPVPLAKAKGFDGVAGAVEISSFACGCDAVLKEFVEKEFKSRKIPFLYLLIDEQTGEAGLQTRLEAFIDTL